MLVLDLEGVFTFSSNIGTAKIAQMLGIDLQYNYFENLGFKVMVKKQQFKLT